MPLSRCLPSPLAQPPAEADPNGILRKPIPERLVVLTFDDGPASHATVVAPVLKSYVTQGPQRLRRAGGCAVGSKVGAGGPPNTDSFSTAATGMNEEAGCPGHRWPRHPTRCLLYQNHGLNCQC